MGINPINLKQHETSNATVLYEGPVSWKSNHSSCHDMSFEPYIDLYAYLHEQQNKGVDYMKCIQI